MDMIKGILFDKDGTLFDFNLSWGRWARQFIDEYTKSEESRHALAKAMLFDYEQCEFDPKSPIIAGTLDEIVDAVQSVFPHLNPQDIASTVQGATQSAILHPVCDLNAFLGSLKARGLVLGVATNDDEKGACHQLEHFGALSYFDFIAGYDSGYGAKPGAGMCEGFLKACGLKNTEAIMVGDSMFDILAGQTAGMKTIGVLTGTATANDLEAADFVFKDITFLPDWLNDL